MPTPRATPTAAIFVAALGPEPAPRLTGQGDEGIRASLADYEAAVGDDPSGAKTQAFATLSDFADPQGPYPGAGWLEDDGKAHIYEALALIVYTEGHTSYDVRQAVAAWARSAPGMPHQLSLLDAVP